MKIGEFFVQLGVDADTIKLKDFVQGLGDMSVAAVEAVTALTGISFELSRMIATSLESAVGFQKFQDQTGLSAKELQKWQIAAEQVNVSADTVNSSVRALQDNLTKIRMGMGGNIAGFMMLGIDPRQNPLKILDQLRKASHEYERAYFSQAIEMLGISREMMSALLLTDQQFDKLSNTVQGMNWTQFKEFLASKRDLVELGQNFKQLGFGIVQALEPVLGLVKLINLSIQGWTRIFEWINLMKEDVKTFAKGGGSITGDLLNYIDKKFGTGAGYKPGGPFPWEMMPAGGPGSNTAGTGQQNHYNYDVQINNHGSDPQQTAERTVKELDRIKHANAHYADKEH